MDDYSEHGLVSKVCVERFAKLNQLREANELCDVTLIAEGKRLRAHRNVLSAGSPYFWKMFTSSMLETNLDEISIPNINYETIEQVIQFLYTSKLRLTPETAQNILIAANFLEMLDLVEICGIFCVKLIDVTNCFSMRELFTTANCDVKIIARANDYINKNLQQLTKNKSFLQLDINSVVEFLSDTELCCKSEEDVVHAAIKWLNADSGRKRYAQQIFNCIRLPLLSDNCKAEYIDNNPLFHEDVINRNIESSDTPRALKTTLMVVNKANQHAIHTYDISTKQWKKLVDIPEKRYRLIATNRDYLVLCGLEDDSDEINFFDLFNFKTNQWTSLPSLVRENQTNTPAVMEIVGRQLYVFGYSYNIDTLEYGTYMSIYDMETESWTEDPQSISSASRPQFVTVDKNIYMFGDTDYKTKVRKLDTETKTWEDVGLLDHTRLSKITAFKGKMYFSKNLRGLRFPDNFHVYDPVKNETKDLAQMRHPQITQIIATSDGIYGLRCELLGGGREATPELEFYDVENDEWQYEMKFPDEWKIALLSVVPNMYCL